MTETSTAKACLKTLNYRRRSLSWARDLWKEAIRNAVAAGVPKTEVAKAAGISRPTLYAVIKPRDS